MNKKRQWKAAPMTQRRGRRICGCKPDEANGAQGPGSNLNLKLNEMKPPEGARMLPEPFKEEEKTSIGDDRQEVAPGRLPMRAEVKKRTSLKSEDNGGSLFRETGRESAATEEEQKSPSKRGNSISNKKRKPIGTDVIGLRKKGRRRKRGL